MSAPLQLELGVETIDRAEVNLAIAGFYADERPLRGSAGRADWRLCDLVSRQLESGTLGGDSGEAILVATFGRLAAPRALLLGLVLYTSAFVAEIVRAGIQSVSRGQVEAAKSIGLRSGQVLRLVILPQALRVIIPPLTSQMLNLTKNSSLAIAIGYSDFVSVANTTINQTGQAIEGVALIMVVYLFFSLSTSIFMNWYNNKMALVER